VIMLDKDIVKQLVGFLMAVLLFLGTINIKFDWFTEASINAFGFVVAAAIALGINLWTIYKNHYGFTARAKAQKSALKRQGLLKEREKK
jgi:protein-S-isoprenylcysteine O-methyltransferase Ste14